MKILITNQLFQSTLFSAFYFDNSTFFQTILIIFLFFVASQNFHHNDRHNDIRRLPAENDRRLAPAFGSLLDLPKALNLS